MTDRMPERNLEDERSDEPHKRVSDERLTRDIATLEHLVGATSDFDLVTLTRRKNRLDELLGLRDARAKVVALVAALTQAEIALHNVPSLVEGEHAFIAWFDNSRRNAIEASRAALRNK